MIEKNDRQFKLTVINPHKSIFISPRLVDFILFGCIFAFLYGSIIYSLNNNLSFMQFNSIDLSNLSESQFIMYVAIFVLGPYFLGKFIFVKTFINKYLSTAHVTIYSKSIKIDFINKNSKYCSTHKFDLSDLDSYAIFKNTIGTRIIKHERLLNNIGIKFVTRSESITLRLKDYRILRFRKFDDINQLSDFADFLSDYIRECNEELEDKIRFKVPFKWRKYGRFILAALIVLGVFMLLVVFGVFLVYLIT